MGTGRVSVAHRVAEVTDPQLPQATQTAFVDDPSPQVRAALASRADLVPAVARGLAADVRKAVRHCLATNAATPPDVLTLLLNDREFLVRWDAAQNAAATPEVHLAGLASGDADVAQAVGQLGDTLSAEVIEALLRHPVPAARERLAEVISSPALLRTLAADPAPAVRAAVALSDHVDEALLRQLATDRHARVRSAVAAGSGTPRELVERLAEDRSVQVRFWSTASAEYDAELARIQINDPDEHVRQHARERVFGDEAE